MELELATIDPLDTRRFIMAVRRLADNLSYGNDNSPFLGTGTDYVQSRLYQPGDPIRAMDWRITARTRKHHVKEYETPKRMPCYLLIDTSASMVISSTPKSKYALAVHIAGGLAFASLDRMSPVALLGVGERELRYAPSLSRDRVLQWLVKLRRYRTTEQTRLSQRIREVAPILLNRALIIVLSDLNEPQAIGPLKRLAQQHDVVTIQLRDPAEKRIASAGFLDAGEAETGRSFTTRGRKLGMDHEWIRQQLRRGRVDNFVVDTDQPFAQRLRHFFRARGLLGRGAR
jgi:uncharacterized protein (DUF58 family)